MIPKIILGCAILGFTATGCSNTDKQKTATENNATLPAPTTTVATTTAPAPNTPYITTVADLRIRETPTMNGKVLTTVAVGTLIIVTGKTSAEKVTVNLQGKSVTDVFYEVSLPRGGEGWVFGGAIAKKEDATAKKEDSPLADPFLVTNTSVGGITKTTTLADLTTLFGKANITTEKEIYANGDVPPFEGVTIYKGKPDEIEIGWSEDKKTEKIGIILIRTKGGKWHTAEGIKVGTTLAELNKINGKPFLFSGFGWDFGGYINKWNGGKLESLDRLGLRLTDEGTHLAGKYQGEVTLKSDTPDLLKAKIEVGELSIGFQ